MKILAIYTGGTIGMVKDPNTLSLTPGGIEGIQQFLNTEELLEKVTLINTRSLIDSSNFNRKDYQELSSIIKENYQQYDAFLILMGTDTMAYISSLLSFCISGLSKPIVFTGGQKTLYENNSDSQKNLSQAIKGLLKNSFPTEVGIYFSNKWHRAVCTTKHHTKDYNAYVEVTKKDYLPAINESFEIITEVKSCISVVKITPFDDETVLLSILDNKKINGIVLEIFGSAICQSYQQS